MTQIWNTNKCNKTQRYHQYYFPGLW